ncbi:SubName: Full=Uncharacterized protein {ECO:0000313/EMBL:CCA75651.1} [Serendipita indica DSM 11827]|uniref:T6SS Phospholipase effector Tle1-like catalytic domain-containing protein n=2 Tax=Serendipita indica (strain DSM 11827) TaxID=1109443 RepID=G4TWF8_SERID|nr:SubName: Full=Uncharacterized protein {ECO:0000313/EMBL:CCA75651.1} [Serendipita indica DSM 11827]CCA75651.1 hypothetical protein PIIN_09641 [Serendipita indica DSM 11827]
MSVNTGEMFKFPVPFDTQCYPELDEDPEVSNGLQDNKQEGDTGSSQEQPFDRKKLWKRLIVCCDGTGQSSTSGMSAVPTNVTRLARAIDTSFQIGKTETESASEIPQIVLYQTGIGTEEVSIIGSGLSGAFGYGVDRHILEAYTFFSLNYEDGDEMFLFGFSRGAFTARAIASLICNVGLLTKDCLGQLPIIYARYKQRVDTEESRRELEGWVRRRVKKQDGKVEIADPAVPEDEKFTINEEVVISVMGLFDTVGSLGIPDGTMSILLKPLSWLGLNNKKYQYHDTSFPVRINRTDFRAHIDSVYQVLALDECRTPFTPTLLYDHGTMSSSGEVTKFRQVWMPGVHTDVGGGYERAFRDLSDISFAWMYDHLKGRLNFRPGIAKELEERSLDPARSDPRAKKKPTNPPVESSPWAHSKEHDEYHTFKFKFGGQRYRNPGQYYLHHSFEKQTIFRTSEFIHPSVRVRMLRTGWRPPALHNFALQHDADRDTYYWARECEVPGKGNVQLRIEEWRINIVDQTQGDIHHNQVNMESYLLDPEAVKDIQDLTSPEKIGKVTGQKSGWLKWLLAF